MGSRELCYSKTQTDLNHYLPLYSSALQHHNNLKNIMTTEERKQQLHDLYGVHFPDDLFEFWDWYTAQPSEITDIIHHVLELRLVGVFDVLCGQFDNVQLRYSPRMHWRFAQDPPEFITIAGGSMDGLHWGYWFDDPERLAPVVVSYFARDAFELRTVGNTWIEALYLEIEEQAEGMRENIEDDPDSEDYYVECLEDLDRLRDALPPLATMPQRVPTHQTSEGMGIVADGPEELIAEFLRGKELWSEYKIAEACAVLEPVYRQLGREPLAAMVHTIRTTPYLPSVDVLSYDLGDYHSLETALAEPEKVKNLDLNRQELSELPDISSLINLEELSLWKNTLSTLPASLAGCRSLRRINLHDNKLDVFPEVLFELPVLESVQLGRNKIQALPIPTTLPPHLHTLAVEGNPIPEDHIKSFQAKFPSVELS